MLTDHLLPRSLPEEQGVSSKAITDFILTAQRSIESLHSFMLLRHGKVIAEGWWYPWRPAAPHMLFSLSKSFTSTAVGLAISENLLTLNDPVHSFFPEKSPKKVDKNLAAMQIRHLLSMSTGHDQDTTDRVFSKRDPIKAFLSLPVEHTPGTHFAYNSAASFILAAIVQKLSGETLVEYLTPRLFEPLGIKGASWESHPNGINFGGWGLSITTEDIARFGQLYLQKGYWDGQQILPALWVEEASSCHVSNGDDPSSDWAQGYGYQFWRSRHNIYRGDGAFGQFCIIMPKEDAVMAITAGVAEMQPVLNQVWEKILPAMTSHPTLDDHIEASKLENIVRALIITPPQGAGYSPSAIKYSGKLFDFEPNYETLESLRLDFAEDSGTMTYRLLGGGKRRGVHQLEFGSGQWIEGESFLGTLAPLKVAASGVWTGDDTFVLTICQYETPFITTITFRFDGTRILYDVKTNVAFGPLERPQLIGFID